MKNIYQKLYKFKQKEVKLVRDTKWFNYSYATLLQIQEKLNPILKELNLVVLHKIENDEVVTQLIDIESWELIESKIKIDNVETTRIEKYKDAKWKDIEIIDKNTKDPQWVWSIITYYRRYNLLALLDLETEDDDAKTWSIRAVNNIKSAEKHICKKCWEKVSVKPFQWKFWMCFKCPECNQFSWTNLAPTWTDDWKPPF